MSAPPIRVLLADDHTLVRAGFRALLKSLGHFEIVAEASDGHEAIRLARSTHPNLIFMDIGMKELNGVDASARITEDDPNSRIIMLSMLADPAYARRALRAGASGYLLKGADVGELNLAIKAVMRGDIYLTPKISKDLVKDLLGKMPETEDPLAKLTLRQREILQLVTEGCSSKEIAQRLDLSLRTVESHRTDIMTRLNIHDVPKLVQFAIRTGLIVAGAE
ncbi:MAG: response regulator transcription factor [Nitrospira sp.]|nr:response regulator transcription factor [Nitrospira sp.]